MQLGSKGCPSGCLSRKISDQSTVYEIGRCEHAAFVLIRKNANSLTDRTTRHETVEHLEVRVLLFCSLNSLIWIAFASQNSSEKLQLCHAPIRRFMVLLFDPSTVFFVRLRVGCGSSVQRVRDISDLSVFKAIRERTL